MSLKLSTKDPEQLSDQELLYLITRESTPNGLTAAQIRDLQVEQGVSDEDLQRAVAGETTTIHDLPHTGDANTVGRTQRDLDKLGEGGDEQRRKDARAAAEASRAQQPRAADDETSDEYIVAPGHYEDEGVTNDDRRAELARRGLATEGKKTELIERLEADDEEDED